MKKLFLFALLVAATSCSSDDDNSNETADLQNAFLLMDEEYPLKRGLLEFWGEEEVYTWDVNLISSEFEVDSNNEEFPFEFEDDFLSIILFELNTESGDDLVAGTYDIESDHFLLLRARG